MKTYRELISLRNQYDPEDPKFQEIQALLDPCMKAEILTGEDYVANTIIMDYGDLLDNGTYFESPEIQKEYKEWIEWFRRWNFEDKAKEMEYWLKRYTEEHHK